jgi:predicted dehydrogenase
MAEISYGMVGGGEGAFIGEVHRKAIALDGLAVLRAGAFSRDLASSRRTGAALGLEEARVYPGFAEMAREEAKREDGIDFAVIATPNYLHYPAALAFLEAGIHVACEKPLCLETAQAERLAALSEERGLLFCVNHAYTGYAAVKEIRALLHSGAIGDIRFVNAEYAADYLAEAGIEVRDAHARWRMSPATSGKSNCLADIGTHVEDLVSYVTGLRISKVCARLDTLVPGRELDDNATVLLEYSGGAKGLYWASQVAVGRDNGLRVRAFGSRGSVEWCQEDPEHFRLDRAGGPAETWTRGREGFGAEARACSRLPSGHPEGYIEATANIYRAFIGELARLLAGLGPSPGGADYPSARRGLEGVAFVEACVESSARGSAWVDYRASPQGAAIGGIPR